MRHYIRVTAGPYAGEIYEFATKKDALALESALHRLRPHSTDYGNDRDGFPETHLRGRRASTSSPLREVRERLRTSDRAHSTIGAPLKIGDAVQLRWEPETGGVIRRLVLDEAWVATPRGERVVPVDALRRVRKEHESRVRRSAGSAHATKRVPKTKLVHVVQGNYGYGHGWEDLTAEDDRVEARARLREYRENESGTPFRLIRRREKIAGAGGAAHARKKKLDPREAKQRLKDAGIDFGRDFHELRSSEVDEVLAVAREAGYRKRKDAPGSTARMYFQYLKRQP